MSLFNPTVAWITLRGLLGRRRFLLLFPLPALLLVLTVVTRDLTDAWATPVLHGLGLSVVLPLAALITGTSVLGSEIDDGTVVHVLAKPLPRREIVLSKFVVAFAVTVVTAAVPLAVAGAIGGGVRLAAGLLAGASVGAFAYCALFVALGIVTRRAVAAGLLYVLVWEGLLGNLLTGTHVLSVQQYALTIADRIAASDALTARLSLGVAAAMSGVLAVAGLACAIDRLKAFSLTGETG
ncbi:ABC transporter permease [Carbonactinospora thermoautotrophica]|uniref:ABC transporter permease subunit n=1 Tax=Carbonactinospora thermoautotrophica TaxID=1469144 RepID=UPI00226F1D69|nr:ABC transporter permease subunit [Carbonactinospora thermoautotrophica]MCX9190502.1 ABC transporter permease [Carbonactinospora thermoautotrophica]